MDILFSTTTHCCMWKVCEPVYSSPLNVWQQFFVVFIIHMMLYSVVYNDVISVIRNIVLEWHDLRTRQLSFKWQFLDICFVSFSSKNPEEAELEDILNSVVSPSTVSVKIANILQGQTFQNLALPNHIPRCVILLNHMACYIQEAKTCQRMIYHSSMCDGWL